MPTNDNGLTFQANLANPFPSGVADPPGASLGPNTFVGRKIDRWEADVNAFQNPQAMRWSISVQRELPHQWVVEAAYVGNKSYDLAVDTELNPVPRSYLSTSRSRDTTTINYLTANVTNPFRGLLPGTSLNGTTVQRQQLLRAVPAVREHPEPRARRHQQLQRPAGPRRKAVHERLHAPGVLHLVEVHRAGVAAERHRPGLRGAAGRRRHAAPAGRQRHLRAALRPRQEVGLGLERRAERGAGGWSVQAIYQAQSGRPVSTWGNVYYNGDWSGLKADYSKVKDGLPIFDTSGFYFNDAAVQTNGVVDPAKQRADTRIRLAQNIRYFPTRLPNVRQQTLSLMDMSFVKRLQFTDRVRGQFHIELLNAFDQPFFNVPNLTPNSSDFGKVTSTQNLPLNVQLAFKLIF